MMLPWHSSEKLATVEDKSYVETTRELRMDKFKQLLKVTDRCLWTLELSVAVSHNADQSHFSMSKVQ